MGDVAWLGLAWPVQQPLTKSVITNPWESEKTPNALMSYVDIADVPHRYVPEI